MKALLLKLILCAVLLAIALTSDAQYRKLTRGEKMPYDTGVAIEISQYRIEGLYIKKSRILIDSLNVEAKALTLEVDSLYSELAIQDKLYKNQQAQTAVLTDSYVNLSGDVNKLSGLFDQLADSKKKPWIVRALVCGGKIIVISLAGYGAGALAVQIF